MPEQEELIQLAEAAQNSVTAFSKALSPVNESFSCLVIMTYDIPEKENVTGLYSNTTGSNALIAFTLLKTLKANPELYGMVMGEVFKDLVK